MVENIRKLIERGIRIVKKDTWQRDIWLIDVTSLPKWQRRGVVTLQLLTLSWDRFKKTQSDIQAAALTYITLLSLVPMLAFAFSVLKNLGFYSQLQEKVIDPLLADWIPAQQAPELHNAIQQMLSFVEQTDVSSLGTIGLITIGYAVIRLLTSVEISLNQLWSVKKNRPLSRKISDYLSVGVIVPVVLLIAGSTADWGSEWNSLQGSSEQLTQGWENSLRSLLAYSLVWVSFTFLYRFMPNTDILLGSALSGAIFGGTVWILINKALIQLQLGVAGYNAIYAGFSALPIFMFWIYLSWWAVLIGGAFAASYQLSDVYRYSVIRDNLNFRDRERLGLQVALSLASQYQEEKTSLSIKELEELLEVEHVLLEVVLSDLEKANLCVITHDKETLLARPAEAITIWCVLDAIKGWKKEEDSGQKEKRQEWMTHILKEYQNDTKKAPHNLNLLELSERFQKDMLKLKQEDGKILQLTGEQA